MYHSFDSLGFATKFHPFSDGFFLTIAFKGEKHESYDHSPFVMFKGNKRLGKGPWSKDFQLVFRCFFSERNEGIVNWCDEMEEFWRNCRVSCSFATNRRESLNVLRKNLIDGEKTVIGSLPTSMQGGTAW